MHKYTSLVQGLSIPVAMKSLYAKVFSDDKTRFRNLILENIIFDSIRYQQSLYLQATFDVLQRTPRISSRIFV